VRLRTQILLFFFLFALVPLLAAVLINLPLVLERTEMFFHKAHLQNLRADFRDLDEHLASRQEMARLLAKLPEPGTLLGEEGAPKEKEMDLARARYTVWVNRIFQEQADIIQITFLDWEGRERFWLVRNPGRQEWTPSPQLEDRATPEFVQAGLGIDPGTVLVSPISIDPTAAAADPRRLMTLRLISPIGAGKMGPNLGAVVLHIDVGGMARAYRNTLWVHDNGTFLEHTRSGAGPQDAFGAFPGLQEIFLEGKPGLWKDNNEQIMWVPLFLTEQSGPLWVGRRVDPSPLAQFRDALIVRVLSIILVLVLFIWLGARWLADRADRLSAELTGGIRRVLAEEDVKVSFQWRGPRELQALGRDLSRLADEHRRNIRNLRDHARELEESNRYKSQFLANVSHELRTPLNSILLLSKMLASQEAALSPEHRRQAQVIHEAGRDLRSLIDNILDLSRIEAGRTPLLVEEVDLPNLLGEVSELVEPQFAAKGLPLVVEIAADAPRHCRSDPDKIRQILKNFLSNAMKFTDHGQVTLRLEKMGREKRGCPIRISVEDTGIGIPSSQHAHIFEAFRQADGATNRRYGGTGLGLTISKQLAQLLGGLIELESSEGRGATFSLLLPLEFEQAPAAEEEPPPIVAEPSASAPPPVPRADFSGRTILVVSTDVNELLRLTPLLEGWGARVRAAGDAEEALETLAEERIDLALVELLLPGDAGYDTIGEIRALPAFEGLPLVALAAGAEAEAPPEGLALQGVLNKPLDPVQLEGLLRRLLGMADGENTNLQDDEAEREE